MTEKVFFKDWLIEASRPPPKLCGLWWKPWTWHHRWARWLGDETYQAKVCRRCDHLVVEQV